MNTEEQRDILEEARDHLVEAAHLLRVADLGEYFHHTALAQLEGSQCGWLGDNFLIDQLNNAIEVLDDEEAEASA